MREDGEKGLARRLSRGLPRDIKRDRKTNTSRWKLWKRKEMLRVFRVVQSLSEIGCEMRIVELILMVFVRTRIHCNYVCRYIITSSIISTLTLISFISLTQNDVQKKKKKKNATITKSPDQ